MRLLLSLSLSMPAGPVTTTSSGNVGGVEPPCYPFTRCTHMSDARVYCIAMHVVTTPGPRSEQLFSWLDQWSTHGASGPGSPQLQSRHSIPPKKPRHRRLPRPLPRTHPFSGGAPQRTISRGRDRTPAGTRCQTLQYPRPEEQANDPHHHRRDKVRSRIPGFRPGGGVITGRGDEDDGSIRLVWNFLQAAPAGPSG